MKNNKPVILCMLWGKWGGTNSIQYVKILRNMVARHTTIEYDFYCITDRDMDIEGVNTIKMPEEVATWHFNIPKFYMHKTHEELKGRRILFFDLDTIIVNNIDQYLQYDGELCAIRPFNPRNYNISTPGGVLGFENGNTEWIWNAVCSKPEYWADKASGKERLILSALEDGHTWDRWQDLFPNTLVSYKKHVLTGEDVSAASIVAFHGDPRPHVAVKKNKFTYLNWK